MALNVLIILTKILLSIKKLMQVNVQTSQDIDITTTMKMNRADLNVKD
jgi:hypothetical protein